MFRGEIVGEDGNRHNRKERRQLLGDDPFFKLLVPLTLAEAAFKKANMQTIRVVNNAPNQSYATVVFEGQTTAVQELAALRTLTGKIREIPSIMSVIHPSNHPTMKRYLGWGNPYTLRVGGTTLEEMERLPTPLDGKGLSTITRMFKRTIFSPKGADFIRERLIFLVAEPLIRPDQAIPQPVLPLYNRTRQFFNYISAFITEPYLEKDQELQYLGLLAWGGITLSQGMGIYVMARDGLSPASLMKMFRYKASHASGLLHYGLTRHANMLSELLKHGYPKEGPEALPPSFHPYLQPNRAMDKQAAGLIEDGYKEGGFFDPSHTETDETWTQFRSFMAALRGDILGEGRGSITIPVALGSLRAELTASCRGRNSRHKDNFLFVLVPESQPAAYLTLETVGQVRRLYGIPPDLSKKYPQVESALARDVLGSVIKYARQRHPVNDCIAVIRKQSIKTPVLTPRVKAEPVTYTPTQKATIDRRPLRSRGLLGRLTDDMPPMPKPVELAKIHFEVKGASPEKIAKDTGRRIDDPDVTKILNGIEVFRHGNKKNYEKARSTEGWGRLREGRFRVVLADEGGNMYSVVKVVRRGDHDYFD